MEKTEKTAGLIGLFIAVVGLGIVVYRNYKKEVKRVEEQEKIEEKRDEELKEIGITSEKLDSEIKKEEGDNLVKGLYISTRFNPNWDIDTIDVDKCLDSDRVIHLMQENENLKIMFEIPEIKKGSYKDPKIGDYISAFSGATNNIWSEIIKFCPKPKTRLEGYLVISFERNGNKDYGFVRIPKEFYEAYSDEKHDGLTEFISKVQNKEIDINSITSDIDFEEECGISNVKALEVQLFFVSEFQIQQKDKFGINLKTGVESLKYLTENLVVYRDKNPKNKGVEYRNIFFHAPDQSGEWDLLNYYDVDENGKVDIFSYTF